MKDMKLSKKEAKKSTMVECADRPEYPYGLRIDLYNDAINKLGVDISDFSVGDEVDVTAKAKVVSISSTDGEGMGKQESIALQITKMEL